MICYKHNTEYENLQEEEMMIDLHMHSRYSDDGEFTPERLVFQCREKGIHVMSVTDHNCVRANLEAKMAAERLGIC